MKHRVECIAVAALSAAGAACLPGCEPVRQLGAAPVPHRVPDPVSVPAAATSAHEAVFRRPSPASAADQPSVLSAEATVDTVRQSLTVVHNRLASLKSAKARVQIEGDLRRIAQQILPLVAAARSDCDAILRAARDLEREFPSARKGYEASAELYRERARKFRDAELRKIEQASADEFDRQAADVPRRLKLTAAFIEQLVETQDFLGEAERCLRDTAAALAILSAGPGMPRVSLEGRAFRRRLEEFVTVVEEYQEGLLGPTPPADAKEGSKPPGRPDAPPQGGGQSAPVPEGNGLREQRDGGAVDPEGLEWLHDLPERAEPIAPPVAPRPVLWPHSDPVAQPSPIDPLRAGATLGGHTMHAGIVIPATMIVRERQGRWMSGEIRYATAYGPALRAFRGRALDGGGIEFQADRVEGNILPTASVYRGRIAGSAVEGSWSSGGVVGSFRFTASAAAVACIAPGTRAVAVGRPLVVRRILPRRR